MKLQLWVFLFSFGLSPAQGSFSTCNGKFANPLTDVCWSCMFPLTLSSAPLTPSHTDFAKYTTIVCKCGGVPPRVGIPISFWEPARLVDVTRVPYCLVGLGGVACGADTPMGRGTVGVNEGASSNSFYHVHWYVYPLMVWLELFTDLCFETAPFDLAYMTEFDPFWNDPEWSLVLNPEAMLFASPLAHLACVADCVASSAHAPLDALFWCGGCEGSLYPFTGAVNHHVGAVQASSLLVHRMVAKLHRCLILQGRGDDEFCGDELMPIIKKSLYKTQMVYPRTQNRSPCYALGASDIIGGLARSFPAVGEDFSYLMFIKRQCCIDLLMPAITLGASELLKGHEKLKQGLKIVKTGAKWLGRAQKAKQLYTVGRTLHGLSKGQIPGQASSQKASSGSAKGGGKS